MPVAGSCCHVLPLSDDQLAAREARAEATASRPGNTLADAVPRGAAVDREEDAGVAAAAEKHNLAAWEGDLIVSAARALGDGSWFDALGDPGGGVEVAALVAVLAASRRAEESANLHL